MIRSGHSVRFGEYPSVYMQEVNDLCNGCNGPGENIKQIQRRDRLKVCKYSVDPYNTEYTGTHDHDEHGNQTLSKGSGSGNGAVHKSRNTIGKAHDGKALKTGSNDSGSAVNRDKNCFRR